MVLCPQSNLAEQYGDSCEVELPLSRAVMFRDELYAGDRYCRRRAPVFVQ